jgi:phospholipid N-methyltransferase
VIVELGPGTGALTREILRAMRPDARLVAVEISPMFVRVLRRTIRDSRLTVLEGSAVDLEKALQGLGVEYADVVVSGIPFSTIGRGEGRRTLQAARRVLGPGGRFVAYQFRSHVRRLAEPLFGPAETHRGLWNFPPMRIYVWRAGISPEGRAGEPSHALRPRSEGHGRPADEGRAPQGGASLPR